MLTASKAVATVATSDLDAARTFYGNTLGLTVEGYGDQGFMCSLPDGSALNVYLRPDHRPPDNTAITFLVRDVDTEVGSLRGKGVRFEEYDMPGLKTVDGVASDGEGWKAAWFKDPAGNILSLGQMP